MNRRAFLKAVGLTVGAVAAPPLLAGSAAPAAAVSPAAAARLPELTLGVVAPSPTRRPTTGNDFLAGLQTALDLHARGSVRLVVENYGASVAAALAQTRALLTGGHANLVVTTISAGMASSLAPLLAERGAPLIVASAGANVARQQSESPYLVRSSLGYWESSYAAGAWAARNLGRRAFMATSFYDSGYDANYAFQLGFEHAGGALVGSAVSHLPTDTRGLAPLMERVAAQQPDLVYAAYCADEAVEFVQAYAAAGLARQIPLLGSGFLTDERILPRQGAAALGIYSALPWAGAIDAPAHGAFAAAYTARTGEAPDAFAALGYDTGRLAVAGLESSGGAGGERLLAALGGVAFDGARGRLSMDPASLSASSPIYLRQVRAGAGGSYNAALAELPAPGADEALAAVRTSVLSGWQYAYLGI